MSGAIDERQALMKLCYFRDRRYGNFGDELNSWMWPKLLPKMFDNDEDVLFIGVGSALGRNRPDGLEYRREQRKIVAGAGYASGYQARPNMQDGS